MTKTSDEKMAHSFQIQGMSCASCVGRVERALADMEGVETVHVNLAAETVALVTDTAEVLRNVAEALERMGYPARTKEVRLGLQGLNCAGCVGRVEQAFTKTPGVISASVNLATETATVTVLDGAISPQDLSDATTKAGYPGHVISSEVSIDPGENRTLEAIDARRRMIIAATLTLPVFLMEMGGHIVPAVHALIGTTIGHQASWLIQWALTTIVLAWPGREFLVKGLPALARGAPDMNSLVAIGTLAAYSYSSVATFAPGLLPAMSRAVYFEAAAVIVTLILLGRFLEARAKGRTGAAIKRLMGLQARTARVERDGTVTDIRIEDVRVGDVLIVRPGEQIAADGEVIDGDTHVDESMITGEPIAVSKSTGDGVTGGTVNGAGGLRVRATHVGADTTLAHIIRMVQDAQGTKLPIQTLVDQVTMWFVPTVLVLAGLTVMAWVLLGPDPALTYALVAGVSVLIIACPCAMGLATPTSIMVGTGRAAELGVLFRKGDALQRLAEVDIVAFDKTGTLTEGHPDVTDLVLADGFERAQVLSIAAAVESRAEHPVADAIVRAARIEGTGGQALSGFEAIPGFGVRAQVGDIHVLIGADRLMTRENIDISAFVDQEAALASQGKTVLHVALDGQNAALLAVADTVKPSSADAIRTLHERGLEVAMITGDQNATAQAIADELGIDTVIAGVLPEGKVAALDKLRARGRKVAFVGDGINDAPALAHADIGIAVGTGTDVAVETADVVLMTGDLSAVINAHEISRKTMRNIRQNLGWAFAYNAALIPVAAGLLFPVFGLLLSPMFAAGAMAFSSFSVVSNALRLRRIQPALRPRETWREEVADVARPLAAE